MVTVVTFLERLAFESQECVCWNYVYFGIQSQSGYLFLGLCFSVMTKSTQRIRV